MAQIPYQKEYFLSWPNVPAHYRKQQVMSPRKMETSFMIFSFEV